MLQVYFRQEIKHRRAEINRILHHSYKKGRWKGECSEMPILEAFTALNCLPIKYDHVSLTDQMKNSMSGCKDAFLHGSLGALRYQSHLNIQLRVGR